MTIGAIFDFDGVLFHSAAEHELCWMEVAREENRVMSHDHFLRGVGVKNARFISEILGWTNDPKEIARLIEKKERLFQTRLQSHPMQPIAGTVDLVFRLVNAHVPCAIGSSSGRKNLDLVMDPFPSLRSSFSIVVSGDQVSHGKPDPEVFLLAAAQLKIPPSLCVVFEDAPLGIEAAKRAGMKAVGLTTTFSRKELQSAHPDMIVESLSEVSVQTLFDLLGASQ